MNKNAITWAEIPVSDFDRAKKFYSLIYDYEMPEMKMGENRMGFLLYDQQGGGIGAVIVEGVDYIPGNGGVKLYLDAGEDLDIILNRVEKAGGKIIRKKTIITPELGCFATFEDSEKNHICLHSRK
jgi:uncharacterized protein